MKIYTKRVQLSDFSGGINGDLSQRLLPLNNARISYNFKTESGALTDGVGLEELKFADKKTLTVDNKIIAVYFFKRFKEGYKDQILLYCSDKYVYSYEIATSALNKIESLYFEEKPRGVKYKFNGNDVFIFSTAQEGLFVYDGETASRVEGAPEITDMALHNERLFVTTVGEKTRLYFSDDFNPFNFNVSLDEGGYIDFLDERGGLNKIVSSLGYLYIFRSYGISRLSSFYAQENFSVSHLFSCVGKIYSESVTPCDNGVMFLTSDGLYLLRDYTVKKVLSNLDELFKGVDNSDCKGMYFNGNFYLKCKVKLDKEENVLVVYSITGDNGYLSKNLSIIDFCPITGEDFSNTAVVAGNGKTLYSFNQSASVCSIPITKLWETPYTDLGIVGKDKVLKKIELYTKTEVKIIVETDKEKRSFLLSPKKGFAEKLVSVRGREFKFVFSCTVSGSEIAKPTLTFSYV